MQHTCFVIQGYGKKTDYESVRKPNLEAPMCRGIPEAGLAIADLSTCDVNAFCKPGVRHAPRPHTRSAG